MVSLGAVARRRATLNLKYDLAKLAAGEEWDAEGPLTIELPEGQHDVEVRQDGFAPFHRSVRVRAGNVTTLHVSLSQ